MKLYELTAEYAALADAVDTGDDLDARLAALEGAIERKVGGVVRVIRSLEAEVEALRAEERRLADRRHARERAAERLRAYLRDCLAGAGLSRVRSDVATVTLVPPSERVVVDDEAAVPDEWCRVRREVDKSRVLRAYLDYGECVPGTRIEMGEASVRIR
jgi:hypothetical protein